VVGFFQQVANLVNSNGDLRSTEIAPEVEDVLAVLFDKFAPDKAKDLYGYAAENWKRAGWLAENLCKPDNIIPERFRLFCVTVDKNRGRLSQSTISLAQFDPSTIKSGESTDLIIAISGSVAGSNHAKLNTLTIDWGDGGEVTVLLQTNFGINRISHQYTNSDGLDHTYEVNISVVGDNDLTKEHSKSLSIKVLSDLKPLSAIITGPDAVDPNQRNRWITEATGGEEPYLGSINWGDGKTNTGKSQTGQFKGTHTYEDEGFYTIKVDVIDGSRSLNAEDTHMVKVGNPPDAYQVMRVNNYSGFNIVTYITVQKESALSDLPLLSSFPGGGRSQTEKAQLSPVSSEQFDTSAAAAESWCDQLSCFFTTPLASFIQKAVTNIGNVSISPEFVMACPAIENCP